MSYSLCNYTLKKLVGGGVTIPLYVVNSNNVISKRGRTSKQLTIHTELENYRNGEATVDNFLIIVMLVSSST